MIEYEDFPSAIGAKLVEETYIIKTCRTCGEQFDNVFEEADHLISNNKTFDPMYILGDGIRIGLGTLMRRFYSESEDPELVRNTAQEIYSLLLSAEFDTDNVRPIIDMLNE